jgi:magnesium chelatase subunit D
MRPCFPFSAIVGQDALKRALLLCVIQPALGGVLVRGTKGVGKSTAVRALAALLPPIETVVGCPFQRRPGEGIPDWPLPADAPVLVRPVPLVELPLGATEDRVLGSLHLEKALRGERVFEPGLLAAANRGLLYIDEVNLLPDHLVDILLDAAASGTHRVEREGLSLSHPARFVLVGTMNPEEGDLRPQLLDRFGLAADVADLAGPAERAAAVRRRLAYENDPVAFAAGWKAADAAEGERVVKAQELLPKVRIDDAELQALSERCLAAGVEGLRADLTMCQAACAWAAYQGRTEVKAADVDAVAELALAHRRNGRPPPPPPGGDRGPKEKERESKSWDRGPKAEDGRKPGNPPLPSVGREARPTVFESAGLFAARVEPSPTVLTRARVEGRWRTGRGPQRGPRSGHVQAADGAAAALAWVATARAAAPYQVERGRPASGGRLILRESDLRVWPPRGPGGCLLLFVVDASGSMGAWQRMRQTKAAVLSLLVRAYQHRDQVAILAFRGAAAELVLPPSRGLAPARWALEQLPVGGTTPLAHGLAATYQIIRRQRQGRPGQPVWTVLLTDGRTNVPLAAGSDPWHDALVQARTLGGLDTECVVVDTETGSPRFGRAAQLAEALGAPCLPLEEVLGRPLPDRWRTAV